MARGSLYRVEQRVTMAVGVRRGGEWLESYIPVASLLLKRAHIIKDFSEIIYCYSNSAVENFLKESYTEITARQWLDSGYVIVSILV